MKRSFTKIDDFDCPHAFSNRYGGYSSLEFSTLNLGFNYGDDNIIVKKNWEAFSKQTKIQISNLVWSRQIHKNNVAIIDKTYQKPDISKGLENYDGFVTSNPNVTLCIFTADCAPVLLCDKKAGVIGALHCGWKPLCADIIKIGIEEMQKLGACPDHIQAAIGPCIKECCFEVGPEVTCALDKLLGIDAFKTYAHSSVGNKYMANLQAAAKTRLKQLGLADKNIFTVNECANCNHDKYFSYRHDKGKTGRMASIIKL